MKKGIPYWQIAGFVFTAVIGTLLHFFFDWTGGNLGAALFSAVNESIWEHLKLLCYPMLLFALAEWRYWGKNVEGFWCVKLLGILLGMGLIVVVYYTYTGALGASADWFNIAIFFLTAGLVFWVETKLFQRNIQCSVGLRLSLLIIALIAIAFTVFTFLPPHIPLFQDPVTGTYGFLRQTITGKRTG